MDVTTGQLASADPSLRWFYLGGLDAYRIAFNDGISTAFDPPKQFVRSETVDSQRGKSNGAAATCISTNGTTASKPAFHPSPQHPHHQQETNHELHTWHPQVTTCRWPWGRV